MLFLTLPDVLSAYPGYYDYVHYMDLSDAGTVEMVDRAGQAFNTLARGKFRLHQTYGTSAELRFYDMAVLDPFEDDKKLSDLPAFRVRFRKEEGIFPFANEVVRRVPNKDDWPCQLFKTRYIFEHDPLDFGVNSAHGNLYHIAERKDLTQEAHIYYPSIDGQSLTRKELVELGITLDLFLKQFEGQRLSKPLRNN
jgi:hypothetical protein